EEQEDGGGGKTGRPVYAEKEACKKIAKTAQACEHGNPKSNVCGKPQRKDRVCDEAVYRERHQLSDWKLALSGPPLLPVVRKARLLGGQHRCETTGVGGSIVDMMQLIEDGTIDQPEVAAVEDQVVVRDAAQQSIVHATDPLQESALIAETSDPDHDV